MSARPPGRLSWQKALAHLGVMGAVAVVLGVVTAGLAIPFAGAIGIGAREVARSMEELPEELDTPDLDQRTQMVDAKGNVIATHFNENRVTVPLDQISRTMVKAIVAIEDYRFYEHGALDLKGTLRAFVANQAGGGVVQGGSSITQQLVKLTLIDQAKTVEEQEAAQDTTYARKLRELRYAIAMEKEHSKDWILERYLNTAYFGAGAHGIQAASRRFFGVNAKDLNLQQASLLAGLVKNPRDYDPIDSPDRALERRNTVLNRMAELGVISEKKADGIKGRKLGLRVEKTANGCVSTAAPWFCDYVWSYLLKDKDLGKNAAERDRLLKSGGLTIRTTIDLRFQRAADQAVAARVHPTDSALGGLAMVVPGTGAVKALAQSRPMGNLVGRGQTYLNYTTPASYGDSKGFQAGSTFKAFVLADALRRGFPPTMVVASPSRVSMPESQFQGCGGQPYGGGFWPVGNSTTSGAKTMYTGTRESVNTFFAQLHAMTGICTTYRLAQQMGVELTNPTGGKGGVGRERTPSFTLGVPDTSPLEMAEAYATFAARGVHCPARPVDAIYDSKGKLVKRYKPDCDQVLPTAVADTVNDILRGVQEPGGFGYSNGLTLPVYSAGKTGTTQSQRAVWFVGYTPRLSTASMVAGANSAGEPISLQYQTVGGSYIASASGSAVAGPMWKGAMGVVSQWLDNVDFVRPDTGALPAPTYTSVPSLKGQSLATAIATLNSVGLKATIATDKSESFSLSETVMETEPGTGSSVVSGGTVLLRGFSNYTPPPPPPSSSSGGGGNKKPDKNKNKNKKPGGGGGGGRKPRN